jgi:ribonuclease D
VPEDRYVTKPDELRVVCAEFAKHPWLALDTEFVRERTFFPKLCLVQVAVPGLVACLDPLALDDLEPLLEVLYQPSILKVLHAGVQDLEIFVGLRDAVPLPLFDTQIAAAMLGGVEQIGYGNLVKSLLGIELEKGHARTDWAKRPLEAEQLRYAADDVRYLRDVYLWQRQELETRGRQTWLREDFAALGDSSRYRIEPESAWRRVKGINPLRAADLASLQQLAAWREREAMVCDKPRRWILGDDSLVELARKKPRELAHLERFRGIGETQIRRYGKAILAAIARGIATPREAWPSLPRRTHLTPAQEAVADVASAVLKVSAARHQVSPANLATRGDLERLVAGERALPLVHGWRAEIAGKAVLALLEGEMQLGVLDGKLQLGHNGQKK